MKTLKFIFWPLVVLMINEAIQLLVVGLIFGQDPDSIFGYLSSFLVYLIFGAAIYDSSPKKSMFLSYIYFLIFCATMIWLGIYIDGSPNVFDKSQTNELNPISEAIMVLGTALGIHGMKSSENAEDKVAT